MNASYFQRSTIELRHSGNASHYGWEIMRIINGVSSVETYFQQNLSYTIAEGCILVRIKLVDNLTYQYGDRKQIIRIDSDVNIMSAIDCLFTKIQKYNLNINP
jgi:hypothetical protein